jgi:AmmeMemoRadiSam system protein B/AmmeMemoRadiSam system protein A
LFSVISVSAVAQTRDPEVANAFYPADPVALSDTLDSYMNSARTPSVSGRQIMALIVPHAGYQFSGKTAALAYAAIQRGNYRRIFVLGPAHHFAMKGAALPSATSWKTPLGTVRIDTAIEHELTRVLPFISINDSAYAGEHSIEVQLPFIQKSLGEVKVVPIMCGDMNLDQMRLLATYIRRTFEISSDPRLVIASSDMSHYLTKSITTARDWKAATILSNGSLDELVAQLGADSIQFCGFIPVITTMFLAEQTGASAQLLGYATSAAATADTSRVVGYGAFAVTKPYERDPLTSSERTALLSLARSSLTATVEHKTLVMPTVGSERLHVHQGAFVTLTKNGELRGCIGFRTDAKELIASVAQAAEYSAAHDPRFPPVADSELSAIKIEISAIGDLHRVRGPEEIQLGLDGLYIRNGDKIGLLLPQVAKQNNWTLQEYLKQLCAKAELDPAALSQPGTELYRFRAEVFGE